MYCMSLIILLKNLKQKAWKLADNQLFSANSLNYILKGLSELT
jgi:hypothetical protein